MTRTLYGLHDPGGEHLMAGREGWIVQTVALSSDGPTDYRRWAERGYTNIVRINWGYGGTGTIPTPDRYADFAQRCAAYVAAGQGCSRWIIGNEPNHEQERPNGQPISPQDYARCFALCRAAIRAVRADAQVLIAAIAPWNVQTGDWLRYFRAVLDTVGQSCDGIALHTYTHGADPALVTSEAKMKPPYGDRRFHFRAFRDFLESVPEALRGLPVYITETNQGDGPWVDANTGWVQAAYKEIDRWNQTAGTQKIHCLALYRWPNYDQWGIEGKGGVQADFLAALAHNYTAPSLPSPVLPSQPATTLYVPIAASVQTPVRPVPPREWDSRLDERGVRVVEANAPAGQTFWRVVRGEWLDEAQAGGRHHIYVDVLDETGQRMVGVPLTVIWPGGEARMVSEAKPGEPYAANYPMSPSRNEFAVGVANGLLSERVIGIGMGAQTPGGFNAACHTSTALVFRRTVAKAPQAAQGPLGAPAIPALVHPVSDAGYRTITQGYGVNGHYYKQYSVDGVALRGHNGLDFGAPVGTAVVAVAAGQAVEVGEDPDGWGLYVKLEHGWGQSLYAHLLEQNVAQGTQVQAGQVVAFSGNSGISSGPHLHFGLRVAPYNRADGWGGYTDPTPYLQGKPAQPPADLRACIEAAAAEFGLSPALMLSLVYAESRFDPRAVSPAGAMGLAQLMPATWGEWSAQVGAGSDPYDVRGNLRAGAAYLCWCLAQVGGDRLRALIAYNWGLGNLRSGAAPPLGTRLYAYSVVHGAGLLEALLWPMS